MDTIKDHIKSKKHLSGKEAKAKQGESSTRQVKSKDLREGFILAYVKLCMVADIPLEKTEKMRPFLLKHCKQASALPQDKFLYTTYVPRLYDQHFEPLKQADVSVSIPADETTDVKHHSILNVLAAVHNKSYLIGDVRMVVCNDATPSQAVIKSVREVGIKYERVIAFVSDSAAYCKKAFRDVLSAVFPNATHVLCLEHIVNLAAEVFHHHSHTKHTADLIAMIKSAFYKKPGRKSRYQEFLESYLTKSEVKLPPVPVGTRWNSWFETATCIYHSS